jgi:hypothetical protein
MKYLLTLLFLTSFCWLQAQEIKGTIEKHKKTEMDITIMAFGMDNWVHIGKVDRKGNFSIDLEKVPMDESQISDENMGPLFFAFPFRCMDSDNFGEHKETPVVSERFLRLTADNDWKGTLLLVSDPALAPYRLDEGYSNAVVGAFFELIYLKEGVALNFTCESQIYADQDTYVDVNYTFDIELKKGFSWIQYDIEEVFETNPEIRSSFPSKVTIRNLKDPSIIKWIGTYY